MSFNSNFDPDQSSPVQSYFLPPPPPPPLQFPDSDSDSEDVQYNFLPPPPPPNFPRSRYAAMPNFSIQRDEEDEEEEEEPVDDPPRVLRDDAINVPDYGGCDGVKRRTGGGEVASSSKGNRGEIEGLFCPICMDAWTSEGDHHICCLPCGHLYGMSCIKKWLQQKPSSAKCPQCNMKCRLKDVRKLFVPKMVVIDEESQKRIRFLESKCDSLEKKIEEFQKKLNNL